MASITSLTLPHLGMVINREGYTLEPLGEDTDLYRQLKSDFDSCDLVIKRVEHLSSFYNWNKYITNREVIEKRYPQSPDFKLNETYLYHGTSADKDKLCEEGFDVNLASEGCFGKGLYFSDTPQKCVKYAGDSGTILVARVILGSTKEYPDKVKDISLVREPVKENPHSKEWRFYDSVKGRPRNFTEYVVYRSERVLLEYIVTFSKAGDDVPASSPLTQSSPTAIPSPQTDSCDKKAPVPDKTVDGKQPSTAAESDSDSDSDGARKDPGISPYEFKRGDLSLDEKKKEFKRVTAEGDDSAVDAILKATQEDLEQALYLFYAQKQVKEEEEKRKNGEYVDDTIEDDGSPIFPPMEPEYESKEWNQLDEDEKKSKMDKMVTDFLEITALEKVHIGIASEYVSKAKYNLDTAVVNYYKSLF